MLVLAFVAQIIFENIVQTIDFLSRLGGQMFAHARQEIDGLEKHLCIKLLQAS